MANEQLITLVGRLTNDPELRFTPSGSAVANFTIACTERVFNRQTNEWKDGSTNFWRCAAWRDMAENVAESLVKGTAVVAQVVVRTRNYETKEGEKRSAMECEVQAIGPDMRWHVAKAVKPNKGGTGGAVGGQGAGGGWGGPQGGGGGQYGGGGGGGWGGAQAAPAGAQAGGQQGDPWAQEAAAGWPASTGAGSVY